MKYTNRSEAVKTVRGVRPGTLETKIRLMKVTYIDTILHLRKQNFIKYLRIHGRIKKKIFETRTGGNGDEPKAGNQVPRTSTLNTWNRLRRQTSGEF